MKANLNPKEKNKPVTLFEAIQKIIDHANNMANKAQKNKNEREYYFYCGIVSGVEAVWNMLNGKYSEPKQ